MMSRKNKDNQRKEGETVFGIEGTSHVGNVRKDNQDCFEYGTLEGGASFAVVCDGMGGPGGGSLASHMATDEIAGYLSTSCRADMSREEIRDMLIKACENANAQIYRRSRMDEELEGMGTTVVLAFFAEKTVHIVHVGDSRAYLLHEGTLSQITNDHSMVQQLVDSGEISPEDARLHPQKNIITRAVGVDGFLSCDYDTVSIEPGDTVLLCTDGLTNMVSDADITALINKHRNPDKLIQAALEAGGSDNITAVLAYETKIS